MKFKTVDDKKLFYFELGNLEKLAQCSENSEITEEERKSFIKKRSELETLYKDKKKSSKAKAQWREKRYEMMRGIKAFHKSTEGKRFHRNLGRFLATRFTSKDESNSQKYDFLKAINSVKTHLFIEMEYFHQLKEQLELEELLFDVTIPMVKDIEEKIIRDKRLTADEFTFILDMTETAAVVSSLASKANVSVEKVEKMWNDIKSSLLKQGKNEDDDRFYGLLVSILKNKLNLT